MSSAAQPLPQFAHAPLLVLITTLLMLQPLSTDLYLASLPSLTNAFAVPATTVQLTLSLFAIGFGAAQLIVGPLSDRFGRRPVLLCGLMVYLLSSLLCGLSNSVDMLIAARFLQALGCCSGVVIARSIVRDAYAQQHSMRVLAKASSWLALASIFAPILGSYLQEWFGWRAAFFAMSLFSASMLLLILLRLPETNQHRDPLAINPSGLRANYRLVLCSRQFWSYALPAALSFSVVFSFISGASFVLIRVLNVPTVWFGYCFAFGVLGYLLGTIICRRLLSSVGINRAFHIGCAISLGSGVFFLLAALAGIAHWSVVLAAMFFGMGAHGINSPIAQAGAVSPFQQQAGTAAGLMGALYMVIAFAVGTIVGATHDGTLFPLAAIVCTLAVLMYGAVRTLPASLSKTA